MAELADRGYEATSLTRVAERAGISKGLIWHYFSGKDELMAATAASTLATIRDRIAGELDLDSPVPDIIRSALRHAAALSRTHRVELAALNSITHNLRHPDGTPRLTLHEYEETYQGQEWLFRRGQSEGTLREFDTRVMAVTYQGAIDAMLEYLEGRPDLDPNAYADHLAEILLAGMQRG